MEAKDCAISLLSPMVIMQLFPEDNISIFIPFSKRYDYVLFPWIWGIHCKNAFLLSPSFWVLLTFDHLHFVKKLAWVYLFSLHMLGGKKKNKDKKILNSLLKGTTIWICDITFRKFCCFVYLSMLLLDTTAAIALM